MNRQDNQKLLRSDPQARAKYVEDMLAETFEEVGWKVRRQHGEADPRPDLIVKGRNVSYVVRIKIASEGRSDRLIPAWSQQYLQAKYAAGDRNRPLAVIAAPIIRPQMAEQLLEFAQKYAPDAAIGIVDFHGLRIFRGPYLEGLDSEANPRPEISKRARPTQTNLFSDLNQWMLKVLLAPELADDLLSAPRGRYENASQLAEAAAVSVMTAFRFVEQIKREGYLHESERYLKLVRRKDLFRRWRTAAALSVMEVPVKYILRSDPKRELNRILKAGRRCLGLFAAADALQIGLVKGVPPHVYVPSVDDASISSIGKIRVADKGETPDLILRQPKTVESVFRGAVVVVDVQVSDILQIWLDVSSHPSRGIEQAELIEDRILKPLISGEKAHG